MEEAISYHAAIASAKLRKQNSVTSGIYVFLETSFFSSKQPICANAVTCMFAFPTSDTRNIIAAARKCIKQLYKDGYQYHKAGLMLLELAPYNIIQQDMLIDAEKNRKSKILMEAIDSINKYIGKNAIFYGSEGINRTWEIKCLRRSSRYTTRWNELPRAYCVE